MPRRLPLATLLILAAASALLIYREWSSTLAIPAAIADDATKIFAIPAKPEPRIVKGLYLTAHSAGTEKKMSEIISLVEATELNAVVIDIKDYSGRVLYDSDLRLVAEVGAEDNRLGDAAALIERLHEKGIYVIARQTVFQDPILARAKPEWAVRLAGGGIWRDRKGLAWVDPSRREVWEDNMAIAREAIGLGFDEINFDYVRFPSDGNLKTAIYGGGKAEQYDVMRDFFRYVNTTLTPEPAWISLDVFGFTLERDDGLQVGQRLIDMADEVDYISPMMYSSHYPRGHLGLANPAAYPALVVDNGMKKGVPKFFGKRAQVRPWLQAFNLGAVYDAEKIRAQIEAVEKYPNAGWLLWNASNRYSADGLLSGDLERQE